MQTIDDVIIVYIEKRAMKVVFWQNIFMCR